MKRTTKLAMPNITEVFPQKDDPFVFLKYSMEKDSHFYVMGGCFIIVGNSPAGFHMSISAKKRYPTWDEISHARYKLLPGDITMAMLLPPESEYVNLSENCLHIWQVPNDTGVVKLR